MSAEETGITRRLVIRLTGAAFALPAAPIPPGLLETRRMSFTPTFVDLVRNYTSTAGTGDFVLGPAVNGYSSLAAVLKAGDSFYYSAIGVDKPAEREVGRGTLQADGTIGRDPIGGVKTDFTTGTKTLSLTAAAEWFTQMQAGGAGAGSVAGVGGCETRSVLSGAASHLPAFLTETGREGTFVFDPSDLSAKVAADVYQGIHVAPASDPTGASGAWVRRFNGAVYASWFGVADGAANNAARLESIEAIFGAHAQYIVLPASPTFKIDFDRRVNFTRPHRIEGLGQGTDASASGSGVGPTVVRFPFGSGKGFNFKDGGLSNAGAQRASLRNLRVEFYGIDPVNGTGSHDPAAPNVINVASGAANFSNGQFVALEGAGISLTPLSRTAAIAVGTNVVTITDTSGVGIGIGNPGVYVGQHIDVAGAGLPAGTTVASWSPSSITLSNNATATVSGVPYTIRYPLFAEIVSGGGTSKLTISTPYNTQAVTGAVLRHMDCAVFASCTIDMQNVEINAHGSSGVLSPGGNCGLFLYGMAGEGTNADNSQFFNVKTGGNLGFAGVICYGTDANAMSFFGCNFAGPKIGVLDYSFLGNDYVSCHWAFNVGISVPKTSANTKLLGGYIEGGTSYLAPVGATCQFYGTGAMYNASGWNGCDFSTGALTLGSLACGRITGSEDILAGRALRGSSGIGAARFVGTGQAYPLNTTGVTGITLWQDTGGDAGVVQADDGGANKLLKLIGSSIDVRPNNVLVGSWDATGLGLASGKVLKIGGTTVLSGQMAHQADSSAADVATLKADFNALLAKLQAIGLMA